jgi:hypothetical protein
MILHNILNRCGTLYLQVWDNCGSTESQFAEVPCVVDPADIAVATAQCNPASMWAHQDIICDFLYSPSFQLVLMPSHIALTNLLSYPVILL